MRIFYFGSDFPPTGGGISTYTREWLKAMAEEKGIKVRATIFGNKEPRKIKVGVIEVTVLRSVNFFYVGWRVLCDMVRYRHYDVFHSFNLFPVGFWTVFWSKILHKKSIVVFHGADACDSRTTTKVRMLQKWTLDSAWRAFSNSEFTRKKVVSTYGISGTNVVVVYPIVPAKIPATENIREKLGLNQNDFVILCVSRLVKRKGIDFLIKAVDKIDDPSVKLVIVGDGPERAHLTQMKNDRVLFTGKVPELAPYYSSLNVGALVSYTIPSAGDFEGLGLVLLEAQSYGKPVIGSSSGGIPEAFKDGVTGIHVQEKNVDEIAAAILKLKKDAKLYSEMSSHTKDFLEQRFGKKAVLQKYFSICSSDKGSNL